MAAILQTKTIANGYPAVTPAGAQDLVAVTATYTLAAALVINDVIEMIELPPGCVPVDVILDAEDLDSGTTLTLDVGIMEGDVGDTTVVNRTTGAEFIAASTVGQAGGVARAAVAGFTRIAPSDARRSIGVKAKAAAAGAGAGDEISLTVLYRPAIHGA